MTREARRAPPHRFNTALQLVAVAAALVVGALALIALFRDDVQALMNMACHAPLSTKPRVEQPRRGASVD